jgi:hypothetical protein
MPLQFRSANMRPTTNKLPLALALPYKLHSTVRHSAQNIQFNISQFGNSEPTNSPLLKAEIQFEVDKSTHELVGLQYISSANPNVIMAHFGSFYFQVRNTASQEIIGGGNSADRLVSNGINDDLFRVSPSCILDANTTIDLFFPLVPYNANYLTYIL